MVKSLKDLCKPRESVFDTQRRDTVLDISDLTTDKIDPKLFFEENYMTEGMSILLQEGFRRLEGNSNQGIFRLSQAMGGGKTHNLITFGLLARHPEYREKVLGRIYKTEPGLGPVKVVAFSGRESDAPFGIWGAIAEQLGKKEHFKEHYSPLRAPGQTAWETLLAGEKVLILLDELPPYFENGISIPVGDSNLAKVTETALSNLLIAIGKESCSQVCLVITELRAAHESGSMQIAKVFKDFEGETHRSAMSLEPVRMGSDELYHILRKRLFEELPSHAQISEVAQAYAQAVREAKQMEITNESPEQFATRIESSYPFHPAIKDLYARFRENPGFQQTRGLIRLMRIIVSQLYSSGEASKSYLIAAHDLDLNDPETRSEINQVNPTLGNAIAHDIAADGNAEAEKIDANLGGSDAQDICRLLLMASLANVPNAVLGLSIPEMMAYLAEPGRDLSRLKSDILERLSTSAWYMHSDRDGKLFFKNVQNLNAKLEDLVKAYLPEQAIKELRQHLERLFKPINGFCYQQVLALPAVDEIELDQDRVTLVIAEPYVGHGLNPELLEFFESATWKNRIAILTGNRNTYENLIENGKRLKAIQQILTELEEDKLPQSDPQVIKANEMADRINGIFYFAVRDTFTTLYYPIDENNQPVLTPASITMRFDSNKYDGEQQIQDLLEEKMKFTQETEGEIFRKKCEQRLFTIQNMTWNEIRRRAGMLTKWQWHHPQALERLKQDCLRKDIWREDGGYLDKGPFPQPKTTVNIKEILRDNDTGEITLKIYPVHADQVYYDFGAEATTASAKLESDTLKTRELKISFLAVDSTGEHETGDPVTYTNRITLKHKIYQIGKNKKLVLEAVPDAVIYYSTDGSDPKVAGATYDDDITIPEGTKLVLAVGTKDGISSEIERIPILWDTKEKVQLDPNRLTSWHHKFAFNTTQDSYALIEKAKKHKALLSGIRITIQGTDGDKGWVELQMYEEKTVQPELLEEAIESLRKMQTSGQVQLVVTSLILEKGQHLLDWAEEDKITLVPSEVKQSL